MGLGLVSALLHAAIAECFVFRAILCIGAVLHTGRRAVVVPARWLQWMLQVESALAVC